MSETQTLHDLADDVVAALRFGRSVLLQAALQRHTDVLRYLLQRISSSSSSDLPCSSPDQPELVKALSEAFLGAAEQGHAHCLSTLLESAAPFLKVDGLVTARNELGQTALIVAAHHGRGDCIKILLQHSPEAQVAAVDTIHEAPALLFAADSGHAAAVSQLLQHNPGAQVAAANRYGNTALFLAAYGGHAAVVSQLLLHNPRAQVAAVKEAGDCALLWAAYYGHAAVVSQLLQHSPEVQVLLRCHNRRDSLHSGRTALLAAVWGNHPNCVALLLAHSPSAQIATVGGCGGSAVEVAARLGQPQCLDLLLAHNPQPQHLDAAWLAALRQWDATDAHTSPHTQCLERLLAKGAVLRNRHTKADKAKHRLFLQDWGSRALVAERTNEAIVWLAVSLRGQTGKAGQGEQQ